MENRQTGSMELTDLGLDRSLVDKAGALCGSDQSVARVTAVDRDRYLVRDQRGEVPAELTGRLLHLAESSEDLPCVGDWVCARYRDAAAHASIHGVLPRRSFLRLVMFREGHIEPVVLLTKADLVAAEELERLIARIGGMGVKADIVCVSNVTGEGIDATFADIDALALDCRYADCSHGGEPGCAVRAALERHELAEEHLQNHLKLRKESGFHELSHAERRRKDRAFGRFVHAYQKGRRGMVRE